MDDFDRQLVLDHIRQSGDHVEAVARQTAYQAGIFKRLIDSVRELATSSKTIGKATWWLVILTVILAVCTMALVALTIETLRRG
ncbi:MAG: hypothetical protein F4137_18145 [Acidobacteria bacterium]|nr:hypothetical protein [Acidobacteriota bacterium]